MQLAHSRRHHVFGYQHVILGAMLTDFGIHMDLFLFLNLNLLSHCKNVLPSVPPKIKKDKQAICTYLLL